MKTENARTEGGPPDKQNEIGKWIRWLRGNYGLSRLDLAMALDVSDILLAHYELGEAEIPASLLKRIADYFNVSVASFFAGSVTASSVLGREITAEERMLLSSFARIRDSNSREAILSLAIASREGGKGA
ncbi:MAG: helix-turn-helix transcriptional regulator [Sneathiella sp.]